jgi:engulfment/cell motility protein 1
MKYLHYLDSTAKFPVSNGLEDLHERIDVSMINEIATQDVPVLVFLL